MAAISMNDSLRELVEQALLISSIFSNNSEYQSLKNDMDADYVSIRSLQLLKRALVIMKKEGTLHSYIAASSIKFPLLKPVKSSTSDELKRRREYLNLRREAKEYNKMIYGTEDNPNEQDILTTGNQFASMTNQLTMSVNMIVAIFAMFGVGYYVGTQYSENKTTQMTFGLVSAVAIMVIEMILFIRRATQMEKAYEQTPSALQESNAQKRSGALLTARTPDSHDSLASTRAKSD